MISDCWDIPSIILDLFDIKYRLERGAEALEVPNDKRLEHQQAITHLTRCITLLKQAYTTEIRKHYENGSRRRKVVSGSDVR